MAKRHVNRVGDLESLFLRLEELVLANSGEDEFEEVFKLLVAKLWDERCGRQSRFRSGASAEETLRQVGDLLREAERAWPGIIEKGEMPALAAEHLQVCVNALREHELSSAGLEVMDGLFEFLVSKGSKGAKGQYFTPRHVIEMCVQMLNPGPDETVLDPACGSGGFLVHVMNFAREHHNLRGADFDRYCAAKIWGFDIDARAVRVAKALMILAGDGSANVLRLNSLLRPDAEGLFAAEKQRARDESGSILTIEDVCRSRLRRHRGFDVILTNPPFAGEVRERHLLDGYDLASDKSRVERDVLFLERCVQLLRPGGRLAIVLPHNKFAMSAWGYLREWTMKKARVLGVVGLGRNTFLPHTHQKASVLFLLKNAGREESLRDRKIFFAISERDGKNSKGQFMFRPETSVGWSVWQKVDHDLGEIAEAFQEFCKSEAISLRE